MIAVACGPALDTARDADAQTRSLQGELEAEAEGDLRAAATANSSPGGTAVAISIADAPTGGTHPWHIHDQSCDAEGMGEIVGDPEVYPPLNPGPQGEATARAVLAQRSLPRGEDFSINIHASPDDMGTVVGCIDLN